MNRQSIAEFFERTAVRNAVYIIAGLLLVVLFAQMLHKANRDIGYDFTSYLDSARALRDGGNPYTTGSPFTYIYPMFLAFALIPLTALPKALGDSLWFLVNIISLYVALKIMVKMALESMGVQWDKRHNVAALTILLPAFPIIQNHMLNGQVNFIVLALCALFVYSMRHNRQVVPSLFLAAASAIKLVPLMFLFYLLIRKRFLIATYTLLFFTALCLLPVFNLGVQILEIYGDYIQSFLLHTGISGDSSHNTVFFTLYGFLKWLVPRIEELNGAGVVSQLITLAIIMSLDIKKLLHRKGKVNVWIVCLYFLAIPLISPLSETHHLAFLLPAAAVLFVKYLYDMRKSAISLALTVGLFFCFFYLGRLIGGPFYFVSIVTLAVGLVTLPQSDTPVRLRAKE